MNKHFGHVNHFSFHGFITSCKLSPPSAATQLVYGLEAKLPLGSALLVSLQQVAAMVVGVVTPALVCPIAQIKTLITGVEATPEQIAPFIAAGIEVIQA